MARSAPQIAINTAFWGRDEHLEAYRGRQLKPAEATILLRYHRQFAGRVAEVGCGGGRLLGYLVEIAEEVVGLDVSPSMVEYCRTAYPAARVAVGDLRSLDASLAGQFDVIVAGDNILDILDDAGRRQVLVTIRGHLAAGGLLVFSTHNLAAAGPGEGPVQPGSGHRAGRLARAVWHRSPAQFVDSVRRVRRQRANHQKLAPLEYRTDTHAVLNDEAHEYSLLHYYIGRDAQARQLEELGYRLQDCLDLDGRNVPAGTAGATSSLYYVASVADPAPAS